MNDYSQNTETSYDLFHEIMKCSNLIRSSLHHNHSKELCNKEECQRKGNNGDFRENRHGGRHGADAQRIGQIRLLSIILEKDGINQKELSELLMIAPASVSELANKLEIDGYIERKQNEDDKRVINVFLTKSGRLFAKKMRANKIEVAKNVFSPLNELEQKQLLELIEKINGSMISNIKSFNSKDDDFHTHHNGPHCGSLRNGEKNKMSGRGRH